MGAVAKHEYRTKFLKSEMWMQIRNRVMTHHKCRCFLCGKVDALNDVHHIEYPKNLWEGPHRHLVVLCRECHKMVHKIKEWPESSAAKWKKMRLLRDDPWVLYRRGDRPMKIKANPNAFEKWCVA